MSQRQGEEECRKQRTGESAVRLWLLEKTDKLHPRFCSNLAAYTRPGNNSISACANVEWGVLPGAPSLNGELQAANDCGGEENWSSPGRSPLIGDTMPSGQP